jgi:hypothetical protein
LIVFLFILKTNKLLDSVVEDRLSIVLVFVQYEQDEYRIDRRHDFHYRILIFSTNQLLNLVLQDEYSNLKQKQSKNSVRLFRLYQ